MRFSLVPHPATPPSDPIFDVSVSVEKSAAFGANATVNFWFSVTAPLARFVIPPPGEPERADELWTTTVFEAFLRERGRTAYREWNFAPSGCWAAYDFASCREGMDRPAITAAPYIRVEDNLTWWTLGATIAVPTDREYDMALSCVLEEQDGRKSYWALVHPEAEKPDFHLPDCFVARLA